MRARGGRGFRRRRKIGFLVGFGAPVVPRGSISMRGDQNWKQNSKSRWYSRERAKRNFLYLKMSHFWWTPKSGVFPRELGVSHKNLRGLGNKNHWRCETSWRSPNNADCSWIFVGLSTSRSNHLLRVLRILHVFARFRTTRNLRRAHLLVVSGIKRQHRGHSRVWKSAVPTILHKNQAFPLAFLDDFAVFGAMSVILIKRQVLQSATSDAESHPLFGGLRTSNFFILP